MSVTAETKAGQAKARKQGGIYETVKVVIQALLIALVIRTFLFQPFNIPSGSMMDTLLIGDYLFVSKYSYGYSRYSFPFGFLPFEGRIFASSPHRGDVAVFKLPADNTTDFIKRVIGLPGDTVQMINGVLYLNGKAIPKVHTTDFVEVLPDGKKVSIPRYIETLPNGVSYDVLDQDPNSIWDNTGVYKVPPGHYFMMGDNRDNSADSRVRNYVGYVPFQNFVGKAQLIFFSVKQGYHVWEIWEWPWSIRWGRIFDTL